MRAPLLCILALLAALSRAEAQDEQWIQVASTAYAVTSFDSLSVKAVGADMIELRIQEQYSPPRELNRTSKYDYVRYDRQVTRERIHCTKLRSMFLETATYLGSVRMQRSYGSVGRRDWGQPLRNVGLRLAERACAIAFGERHPGSS